MIESGRMRARRRSVSPRREAPAGRGFWAEALAIVLMAIAILLLLSLASYRADDPIPWPIGHWSGEPVRNVAGIVGAFFAELLRQLLGHAAWAAPPLLLLFGWRIFWGRRARTFGQIAGYALLILSAAASLDLLLEAGETPGSLRAGGWIGLAAGRLLARLLNRWGGLVVALVALASAFLVPAGQASELAVAQEPVAPSGT